MRKGGSLGVETRDLVFSATGNRPVDRGSYACRKHDTYAMVYDTYTKAYDAGLVYVTQQQSRGFLDHRPESSRTGSGFADTVDDGVDDLLVAPGYVDAVVDPAVDPFVLLDTGELAPYVVTVELQVTFAFAVRHMTRRQKQRSYSRSVHACSLALSWVVPRSKPTRASVS